MLTLYLIIKRKEQFWGIKPLEPLALKKSVITLGASFIKLAQVLATRSDFFPERYLVELKELHDQLPPMNHEEFQKVYNKAFQDKTTFKTFDETPIASASVGQVHRATLPDNTQVAVKLLRYNISKQVKADIRIIGFFNNLFQPLFSTYTKNSIDAVVSEFSKMILQEVSFNHELQNLQNFSEVYKNSGIRFPKPYEAFCSNEALVMSFEEGFRFDNKEKLLEYDIDFKALIGKLVSFYTQQMLIEGYFHADPHPGNLLVSKSGELILLDFGMVKRVPNDTRIAIIELIKAANEQNYELYISANKRLGTIAYEAPTAELAEFTSKMFAIFSNDNLNSESMQQLAFDVLSSTKDLPFKLPSDAIYILRVSAIIEGLGTTYIENFNGIKDILPILQENIPKALGAKEGLREKVEAGIKNTPFFLQDLQTSVQKMAQGEISINASKDQLTWIAKEIKEYLRPLLQGFVLVVSGFFVLIYDKNLKEIALVLFALGAIRIFYKV
ncbi:MAG: ABC1 family protein [uncultured Sulfurovum sp.]|uniref:ABC1 family protein n=1 Tax=uncultured Sulfurovum sp. TaxID=269237 RepID=A0A6S6SEX6_9BACT|nr:MAG: ABC1 family protein [uncultured Sulfurovum sp.]